MWAVYLTNAFETLKKNPSTGAGSLVLEFATLSRLLGDPVYESYARNATYSIWKYRNATTGLFSNDIDIDTGKWSSNISGLGAGMDSFYEYLIKSYIVFEEPRVSFLEGYAYLTLPCLVANNKIVRQQRN